MSDILSQEEIDALVDEMTNKEDDD